MHIKCLLRIWGIGLALLFCFAVTAAPVVEQQKTQGDFAVQLCKAMGIEVPTGDYIAQLEAKGISPEGGWKANKPISNAEMAGLLAKALGLEKEVEAKTAKKLEEAYRDKATVIRFEGNVNVKTAKEAGWIPAEIGMKLSKADSIKTGPESWIELRVGMVGGIRIKENSEVNLSELSTTPSGGENIILYMTIGEMLVDVRGIAPGSDFQVHTPTTVAAVRGTIYNVKISGELTQILEAD